jgi:hypothetical protein
MLEVERGGKTFYLFTHYITLDPSVPLSNFEYFQSGLSQRARDSGVG